MKRFLQLAVALFITVCVHAQFSGTGSGTSADPYLIFNPIQLDQVRNFSTRCDNGEISLSLLSFLSL